MEMNNYKISMFDLMKDINAMSAKKSQCTQRDNLKILASLCVKPCVLCG